MGKLMLLSWILGFSLSASAGTFSANQCGMQENRQAGVQPSLDLVQVCIGVDSDTNDLALELRFADASTRLYNFVGVSSLWIYREDGTYDRVYQFVDKNGRRLSAIARTYHNPVWISAVGTYDEAWFRVPKFEQAF